MKTTLYVCADGTMTYGPYGGKRKTIKAALPVGIVADEETAMKAIMLFGRKAYDVPEADPDFRQTLRGRAIEPGYGPTHRFYYSGPEFKRNDVTSLFAVRERIAQLVETIDP